MGAVQGCNASESCDATCSMPSGACSSVVQSGAQAGQAGACATAGCGANCENCAQCAACCCVPADWDLSDFGPMSYENGEHEILEVLIDAKAINPDLWLMGSPWSPPAWLKVDGILDAIRDENTLIDDDLTYTTYAKYLAMVAQLFQDNGVPLKYLTLQNEPLFGTAQYPGMYFTAKQSVRLGLAVKNQFAQDGLAIKILSWDHNWDVTNILLGSVAKGSQSSIKWIMVLDENCGPYLPKVTFQWGRPLISIPSTASSMSDIKFNQDFWSVGTLARFIRPGAYRVESQLQSSGANPPAIIEAFRDDTAQTMTLVAVNLDLNRDLPLTVSVGGQQLSYTLTPWSTVNLVWDHAAGSSSGSSAAFV